MHSHHSHLRRLAMTLAMALATLPARSPAQQPRADSQANDVLRGLRTDHPRLYLTDAELPALRRLVETDPTARSWLAALEREAETILKAPTVRHQLIGPRLLAQSRAALDRIATLSLLHRLDGNPKYLRRAREEMLAAAAFPDWNPRHFLDTAEMSHALGLGYDWLYRDLSPSDRSKVREAIVELGLKPGLKVYESGKGWPRAVHNWNQVCNGGLTVGALAIADEAPEIAAAIARHARDSIPRAMATFAPDGGWPEGPGYWSYATRYNVYFLAALRTALGTTFGLESTPGFPETGRFRIHSVGPTGLAFNYADGGERAGTSAQMLWLARTFHKPAFAANEIERSHDRPDAFHLIWAPGALPAPGPASRAAEPLDAFFQGTDTAFFHSAWADPKAIYLAFKGGDNAANHSHLDLGSFVLDADGQRWAVDLGGDDYNLPGYFGGRRWEYFRLRTESHNTLALGTNNQATRAKAPIVAFHSSPARAFAVADLSAAHAPEARRAIRGVALLDRRRVLVQDEIDATSASPIVWRMHTRADISLSDGARRATLTQRGATLTARLLEPSGARFEVADANPPAPQRQDPSVHALATSVAARGAARIVVLLEPGEGAEAPPAVEPLERWIGRAEARGNR